MSLRNFLKFTALGRLLVIPYRFGRVALPYLLSQAGLVLRWTFQSKEHYNHTYHLSPLSRAYLDSYVSVVSGHPLKDIQRYSRELEDDANLRSTLIERTLQSRDRHNCDAEPRYGRRLGWYALIRATKPRIVVETGIDRGLGTVVIAAALKKNSEEGFPGLVYATDIILDCGHLVPESYRPFCKFLIGDSIQQLKNFAESVDIFLHDSDHRAEYEWGEFMAIQPRLHTESLVMSDNSRETTKLLEFAQAIDRSFLYFQDIPTGHWWPGDGIGSAFIPGHRTYFPRPARTNPSSQS